jgi:hypothetical protein
MMRPLKLPECYRELARAARAAGWDITRRRSGHLAWRSPSGAVVFTPATPSDWRAARNSVADLRRAGLAVQ